MYFCLARYCYEARCTTVCDKSLSVTCDRSVVFSGYSNKTDRHDIPETLLKVALNTIKQTNTTFMRHFKNNLKFLVRILRVLQLKALMGFLIPFCLITPDIK